MLAMAVLVCICVGLGAILTWTVVTKSKRRKFPPGPPTNIPYFGQAFNVSVNSAHLKFTEWGKQYGDIYMITMFGRRIVILNHPDIIRRAFASSEFSPMLSDRPNSFIGHFVADLYKDILFRQYDDICQKLRNVTIRALHSVGEGSDVYQDNARIEIRNYVKEITSSNGNNIDIMKPLDLSLCRMIGLLFTGKLLEDKDPILRTIEAFDHHGNEMIMPATHLTLKLLPFLRYLPGSYGNLYRKVISERDNLRNLLLCKMKDTLTTKKVDCLLHVLLEMQETDEWLTDDYILGVIMDLINTSTLTSRGVLSGIFFILVHFPHVQQKIQEEIDNVIGREEQPRPKDRHSMPYTHACIMEVLRYQSHLGLTATHTNAKSDVVFDGYFIPKGSSIYGNQWSVHHDERFWPDPFEFRPERFLQEDGTLIHADHENKSRFYMPFGVGNRSCMGVTMTYNRMFLYVTTLLQGHVMLPPTDQTLPSHDPLKLSPGTVLQAPKFMCRIMPR